MDAPIGPKAGRPAVQAAWVAATYAVIALTYIVVSGRVVAHIATGPAQVVEFEIVKGIVFVILTTVGLFATWWGLAVRGAREHRQRMAAVRRLGDVSNGLPNPLLVLAPDGDLLEWNAALVSATGYDDGRLGTMTLRDLAHPDDLDLARTAMARVVRTGRSDGTDVRLRTADGQARFYRWHSVALHDAGGRVSALAAIGVDLTDLKITQDRLAESLLAAKRVLRQTVDALTLAVEKRDPYTAGHEHRVAALALAIADRMGVSAEEREGIEFAALLHDIGQIAIPSEILIKPGRLTRSEFRLVAAHVEHGYDILRSVDFPWPVAEIIRQHHERLDGSGYPRGLEAGAIRREAMIIGISDVVEAMCSHRPYRPALGIAAALDELRAGSGVRYDPAVVETCLGVFRDGFAFPEAPG